MVTATSKDGTEIASWRSGTGPALVLVHGTPGDHTVWDGLLTHLQPHFTLYAMDRRGRGASGDSPAFELEREIEDVVAVVNEIGGSVHVMGHSYGALCVLEAAALTPNISSLVLYDPPVISMGPDELPPGLLEDVETLIAEERRDDALARVLGRSSQEIEQLRGDPLWSSRVSSVQAFPREMRAGALDYRFNWNGYGDMDRPTLLLAGELSPPRLRASAAGLSAILSNSRVVVLQGQRHGGLRTAPQLVADECIRFLRSSG